ncbi:hypothetical protein [Nonomuraea sp. NPDC046570]|uniref:hypothetical protein n=1 Tax=Nonomuraea sp. NPDC046570 TaxID=3155255 RepID=UPI0033D29F97
MAAVDPRALITAMLAGGVVSLIGLKIYAGVTAPEISPDKLRKAAEIFKKLADELDNPKDGVTLKADNAAVLVKENNAGPAIDVFYRIYSERVALFPLAFAQDCRVIAAGCEAYAKLVEDVRKGYYELENMILQVLWLVAFQPMTTALYAFAQARATAQIAWIVKMAHALRASFGAGAARIFGLAVPKYLMTTINYAVVDGAAYATGAIGLNMSAKAANDQPIGSVGDNATDFANITAANAAYIGAYDAAKLPLRGLPPTRSAELYARLVGSGGGFTPAYTALNGDAAMPTWEEWSEKVTGHGLRAVIFPPGWRFAR